MCQADNQDGSIVTEGVSDCRSFCDMPYWGTSRIIFFPSYFPIFICETQVWTMPTLWKGFVKCCRQTLPRSVGVLGGCESVSLGLPAQAVR